MISHSTGILYPFCYEDSWKRNRFGFALVSNFTTTILEKVVNLPTVSLLALRAKQTIVQRMEQGHYEIVLGVENDLKSSLGNVRNLKEEDFRKFKEEFCSEPLPAA